MNNLNHQEFKKFSLGEILNDSPDFLISQLLKELAQKKPKNSDGSLIRINTLKNWCDLIENQNKKIDQIYNLLLDLKEEKNEQKP